MARPNGAPELPKDRAEAWVGFLAAHARVTRQLETGLSARYGLSLSGLETLSRLAASDAGRLRMSVLAEGAMVSQSRMSRLTDTLAERGLVTRASCPSDSRGVYAEITDAGRELVTRALEEHWVQVERLFFSVLSARQIGALARAWRSVLANGAGHDGDGAGTADGARKPRAPSA